MDMEFTLNTSFNITFGRSFNSYFDSLARRLSKLIITGAIASIIALPVSAQQISAEQMAQFKKLPKAQQEALAKQYGVDLGTINAASAKQVITNPQVVTPALANPSEAKEEKVVESGAEETTADKKESRNAAPKLDMFGYDLFAGVPTTFAPATDIPVPGEYIVGPGDNINLNLYGKSNSQLTVVVDREGKINVPELGPIHVAGLSFQELKEMMKEEVKQRAIGLSVLTTLGELRSVRIFILGEANRPGSYTVSSLSTITNALFVSGGIKKTGSLRNIELKRNGNVVSTFDLYDLLLRGDTSDDVRVLPGDVIFVPPVGQTVGIGGEVKRSAVFELKDETTFADLVSLSGGFLPTTFLPATKVNRIDRSGQRTVLDIDLSQPNNLAQPLRNGDLVRVFSILDSLEDVVTVEGHVYRPGNYAFNKGMSVGDILGDIKDVLPNVDLTYALIRREAPDTREIFFEQFALRDVFAGQTVALSPRDKIVIFANDGERDALIAGDIARLRGQTALNEPAKVVSIIGPVKQPGSYPLMQGMSVKNLLAAAGNLTLTAEEDYAVIVRTNEERDIEVLNINLLDSALLDTKLQAEDKLYTFNKEQDRADTLAPIISRLRRQTALNEPANVVSVVGAVNYAGSYPLMKGMNVKHLLAAAGNLTLVGDEDYAIIVRTTEQLDLEVLTVSLSNEPLLATQLQAEDQLYVFSKNQDRAEALAPVMARLSKQATKDIDNQLITISGEVRYPGIYPYSVNMSIPQLVLAAGGLTESAYLDEIEVSRFYTDKKTLASRNTFTVALETEMQNGDTQLKARDVVQVRRIPQWYEEQYVELRGEFTFPGRYLVRDGESLKQVITRAGGFTDLAYPGAAVFMRESVRDKNQQELARLEKVLSKQIEIAMAAKAMSATVGVQTAAPDMDKITNLVQGDNIEGLGRVAIDLMAQFSGSNDALEVFPNDTLFVPRKPSTVQILGEVQMNSAHVYDSELSVSDYLTLAGGTTEFADDSAVYVIRADGRVVRPNANWFSYADSNIQPGDTIVVPLDVTLSDNLGLWQQVTQIIYNSAVAVAAIRGL
jgi:polysaccharide export outer membrane protein